MNRRKQPTLTTRSLPAVRTWPMRLVRPHKPAPSAAELVRDLPLQPGDVLLTGRTDPPSRIIQRLTDCDVSHAVLVVEHDLLLEAHDDAHDLQAHKHRVLDDADGVHLRALDDVLVPDGLRRVRVLRPTTPVDHAALKQAATMLANAPDVTFNTAGLVLLAVLATTRLQPLTTVATRLLGDRPYRSRVRALVWAASDGPHRVVCSELVVRCLSAAGVPLRPTGELFLADAIAHGRLDSAPATDPATLAEQLRRGAARRRRLRRRAPTLRTLDALRRSGDALRHGFDRLGDGLTDDWADLVTPRDLLRLEPLTEHAAFEHRRNGWVRTS